MIRSPLARRKTWRTLLVPAGDPIVTAPPGPAPSLSSLSASSGPSAGGTLVTVNGSNFVVGCSVRVDGAAQPTTFLSSTQVQFTTAAHAAGAGAVTVRNPDLQVSNALVFTFVAAPAPTGIAPTSGSTAGGTAVTITGTAFVTGATVAIGGSAATSVLVVNSTTITCVTPAHSAGLVSVVVTNPDTQTGTLSNSFTYAAALPTVSSISPSFADTGGQFDGFAVSVTITGANFGAATSAAIGGTSIGAFTVVDPNTITGTVPAKAIGTYDVTVTSPSGTSSPLVNAFEYIVDPASLANIYQWLDANRGLTLTGSDVDNWADQSGNSNDVSQSTGANKPTRSASQFGSRNGITFNGSKWLKLPAKHVHASGLSWTFVVKYTSTDATASYAGDAPLTIFGDSTGGIYNSAGLSAGSAVSMQYAGAWTPTSSASTGLNSGTPCIVTITHSTGGTVKIYVNGTLETTASVSYNVSFNGFDNIGSGYTNLDGFDGVLGMTVANDGVLTQTDVTNLYNLAKRVWGVP